MAPGFSREVGGELLGREDGVALEADPAEEPLLAFLDGDREDEPVLGGLGVFLVASDDVLDGGVDIASALVVVDDRLLVVLELGLLEGPVLEEAALLEAHLALERLGGDGGIAGEADLADGHLRALVDAEGEDDLRPSTFPGAVDEETVASG